MQYLGTKFIMKGGKAYVVSLFGVALDVADVGGDFHGSIWFRPEAAVDCAVQRGLNIKDTCDSFLSGVKCP